MHTCVSVGKGKTDGGKFCDEKVRTKCRVEMQTPSVPYLRWRVQMPSVEVEMYAGVGGPQKPRVLYCLCLCEEWECRLKRDMFHECSLHEAVRERCCWKTLVKSVVS